MNHAEYEEKTNPGPLLEWIFQYVGHEHLADIKAAPSIEKYRAVAPDIYVMAAMLHAAVGVAMEQKTFGEYGVKNYEKPIKPWNSLTEEEKISEKPIREAYMDGLRHGRDSAMIEMANRITMAVRQQLDDYRLENSEYDPKLVVDEHDLPELD